MLIILVAGGVAPPCHHRPQPPCRAGPCDRSWRAWPTRGIGAGCARALVSTGCLAVVGVLAGCRTLAAMREHVADLDPDDLGLWARGSSLHRLRHGARARRPHRQPGPPARARGADNAAGALEQATRGAQAPRRRRPPEAWPTSDHGSKSPAYRLHRATRRRGHRGLGRSRGLLPAQAPPPRPRASSLQARGPFWRDGP